MAAIVFPTDPSIGSTFSSQGRQWEWDGTSWNLLNVSAIAAKTAQGGGENQIFFENDLTVTDNYTITTNKNAVTAGPVTVNNGVTVTIPNGSSWVIV